MSDTPFVTLQIITWKKRWSSPRGITVLIICGAYVALPAILPMYQLFLLSPWGTSEGSYLPLLIVVCSLFVIPVLLIGGIIGLLFRSVRQQGIVLLLTALLFVLSSVVSYIAVDGLRMAVFASLANRSIPLIKAIKRFQADTGAPPQNLSMLVPRYIAQIPNTNIGRYPTYEYEVNPEQVTAPWMLYVNTADDRAMMSNDMLFYVPDEDYTELPWGRKVKPIRNWGYLRVDD